VNALNHASSKAWYELTALLDQRSASWLAPPTKY